MEVVVRRRKKMQSGCVKVAGSANEWNVNVWFDLRKPQSMHLERKTKFCRVLRGCITACFCFLGRLTTPPGGPANSLPTAAI
jgi:hypothetical protein